MHNGRIGGRASRSKAPRLLSPLVAGLSPAVPPTGVFVLGPLSIRYLPGTRPAAEDGKQLSTEELFFARSILLRAKALRRDYFGSIGVIFPRARST
jgi:hypothetical protein